jgi:hypothetical protein
VEHLNPVLEWLGVNPVSETRKEQSLEAYGPRSTDPLSYGELKKYGFDDLVDPIMDLGGYVVVSNALNIEVAPLPVRKKTAMAPLNLVDEAAGLCVGLALEEKIAASLAARPKAAVALSNEAKQQPPQKGVETGSVAAVLKLYDEGGAPPVMKRALQEPPAVYERVTPAKPVEVKPVKQPFELGLGQRAYVVGAAAVVALAWGHASSDAVATGLFTPSLVDTCRALSLGVAVGNCGSAILSVRLSLERGRAVPLWLFKSVLAGPMAISELSRLDPIPSPEKR